MKSRFVHLFIVGASALFLMASSWAGRPLATDDAGVLEQRACELESFAGRAADPDGSVRWIQLGCGIGLHTQIAIGAGNEKSDGERVAIRALTGKTYLRELSEEQAGFALAYSFSGASQGTDSFRREESELRAVVTLPHRGWLLHANLGWQRAHADRTTSSLYGLAMERPGAFGPLDLMAEVYGDDRDPPWLQVGARWILIPERLFLDSSWGVQTNSKRSKLATIGLKIAF